MKLTSQSEYALLALVYLARCGGTKLVPVKDIAAAQGIPRKFLEQILLRLKRARYLHSLKGLHGGYRLAKPARQITLAEIVRLFDGALAPIESASKYYYEPSPLEKERKLMKVFKEVRDYTAAKMERTTLASVC